MVIEISLWWISDKGVLGCWIYWNTSTTNRRSDCEGCLFLLVSLERVNIALFVLMSLPTGWGSVMRSVSYWFTPPPLYEPIIKLHYHNFSYSPFSNVVVVTGFCWFCSGRDMEWVTYPVCYKVATPSHHSNHSRLPSQHFSHPSSVKCFSRLWWL